MKKNATGTREWASHNINIQRGCEHGCLYCYANADAHRFKRLSKDGWDKPVLNDPVIKPKMRRKLEGTIMFPTTHDITPKNITACHEALGTMLNAGNKVLIVTKPHLECVQVLCRTLSHFRSQILWRFTIGTDFEGALEFWEPGAPTFRERLRSLAYAWAHGFETSVSCEPLLTDNVGHTYGFVDKLKPFVTDSIWLGRANHLTTRMKLNGYSNPSDIRRAEDLMRAWNDDAVRDLFQTMNGESKIKWKNSVKQVVGLPLNERDGMDV